MKRTICYPVIACAFVISLCCATGNCGLTTIWTPSMSGSETQPDWFRNITDGDWLNTTSWVVGTDIASNGTTYLAAMLESVGAWRPNAGSVPAAHAGATLKTWVFYREGNTSSSGLGFVYQVVANPELSPGVTRLEFADPEPWKLWGGAGGSDFRGLTNQEISGPHAVDAYSDGHPLTMTMTPLGPQIWFGADLLGEWTGVKIGPALNEYSSHLWFDFPNLRDWKVGYASMVDTSETASVLALVAPVPGAALLGALGLGAVAAVRRFRRKSAIS